MDQIRIYSTHQCPWCTQAKLLLRSRGLDFEEIDISSNAKLAQEMIEVSGRRTVPQIFIGGQHIGGFDELSRLQLPNRQG